LFKRKPIAELLVSELETPQSLKRVSEPVILSCWRSRVIGAGIFGAIGTAQRVSTTRP